MTKQMRDIDHLIEKNTQFADVFLSAVTFDFETQSKKWQNNLDKTIE